MKSKAVNEALTGSEAPEDEWRKCMITVTVSLNPHAISHISPADNRTKVTFQDGAWIVVNEDVNTVKEMIDKSLEKEKRLEQKKEEEKRIGLLIDGLTFARDRDARMIMLKNYEVQYGEISEEYKDAVKAVMDL